MLFPMTIGAYQNALLDFVSDPFPTSSKTLFGNTKIFAPIDMMKLESITTSIIPASGASPALIFNRPHTRRFSTFCNRLLYILGAVSILSRVFSLFLWHT